MNVAIRALAAGLLAASMGLFSGCDQKGFRIEIVSDPEFRCGIPDCPGHTIPGHRCSTHRCSQPDCPGHARPNHSCAYYCNRPGCPGHRLQTNRCF